MKKKTIISLLVSYALLNACDGEKKKKGSYQFGAPNLGEIVESSAPKALTTQSGGLQLAGDCSNFNPINAPTGGWHLMDNYKSWLRCATFQERSDVAGSVYYRYFVNVLDNAMAETETRLAGFENPPTCMTNAPATVPFQFRVEKPDSTDTDTANVEMKINCYEEQAGAEGASQIMAFGKDQENFYLVYLTKHANQSTEIGKGNIVLLAKANIEGTKADIWALSTAYQGTGSGVNLPDGVGVGFSRLMADKVTGAFTQSNAGNGYGGTSVSSFLRSNGTVFSFRGQTSGLVDNALQILDIVNNTDENLTELCFNVNDLSAANLSVCNEAELFSVPSDFGLSAAPRGKMNLNFNQDLRTDITTIMTTTDFAARGVGEFKPEITE